MTKKLYLYYDEEGDFLELHRGPYREGSFHNLGNGIFERIETKTKLVAGVAIMNFKKRTAGKGDVGIALPLEFEFINSSSAPE